MSDRRLRVFVSSRMQELAPERDAIWAALHELKMDGWVFERSAGARPQSIRQTYLDELAAADLYIGVFWKGYGEYTIDEFEHARGLKKACLVYEKRADLGQRDPELDKFLKRIAAVEEGLTPSWFRSAEELADKVKTDVAGWQAELTRQALSRDISAERERLAAIRAQELATPRQRVVNLAPQGLAELFKDRTAVTAEILDALLSDTDRHRAVTIVGQGGTGKTAVACRVMRELEQHDRVHGLVYLSARTTGLSFERIYRDSARMLGGAIEEKLMSVWRREDARPAVKVQAVLEAYGAGRSVVLLDNVETVLDEQGLFVDADLQAFFDAFLAQNHGARLLLTSREPLNPSNANRKYQKVVPLDQGLPADFAVELLRDLDPDGDLGLRDAPDALLRTAAEKTQGYPAALEAIFSILSEEKQLTLEALLADETLFGASVISNLVQAALSRLDSSGHRVMEALAVFGRPVREVALQYLLEPYADAGRISDTLRRLTRGLYINVKRATGELILHPFYREFSYGQIPIEAGVAYNRTALESRAAAYYAQLRAPREAWRSIRDLEPQLAEYEHWVRAEQYDRAADVLCTVDREFLIWHGHARRARGMHAALAGRIQSRQLELRHCESLGEIGMVLDPEQGFEAFTRMRALATELGDGAALGRALRCLGETCRLLGRYEEAIGFCSDALAIVRQQDADGADTANVNFFLGLAYCYAGYPSEAIVCGDEVRRIAAQRQDRETEARARNLLALAHLMLGHWDEAAAEARRSHEAYAEVGGTDGLCFAGNVEAMALFGGGRPGEGMAAFERSLTEARTFDLPRAQGLVLFNQARALRALHQPQIALERAREALAILEEGQFQPADAARPLIEALVAAALGDRAAEVRHLLACVKASSANPDLQPPTDLAEEIEATAGELGLAALAGEARDLAAALRARATRRSQPAGGVVT